MHRATDAEDVMAGDIAQPLPGLELVWSGRVPEHAQEAAALAHVLDAEESARLAVFRRPEDRDAFAVAHVTLRRLLGQRLGQAPQDVSIVREPCAHCGGAHGRPYVPGRAVHFSLSHTSGMVMIALASVPVGIDVEIMPSAGTAEDVATQLHPHERAELAALPAGDRTTAFARCWTRKEAMLKAMGVGLNEDVALAYVGSGARPAPQDLWLIADLPADPGYAAAAAVRRPGTL
ncbi:4'-phosphopantetheinyl transferase superfamily protein [Streptomyces sp. PKU-EA00015]|uniref:4'-phosphopantetheinyl transferase family protein n=1 Tax=Streptomyces sp. PKU-EA00015 TaxID=2748326 RepID=UPI0028122AC3|nr:4'-phosphopantetheinyl transferase superfamily protein [Streptomyces sp. PKU-EA00015]